MRYSFLMVYRSRVAKPTKKQLPASSELSRRINRSKTPHANRNEVLNTTELLERIISFLPPSDILTKAQKVSSAWKDTIAAPHTVQTLVWQPPFDQILRPSVHSHAIEATHDDELAEMCMEGQAELYEKSSVIDLVTGVPKYSAAVTFQDLFFTGFKGPDFGQKGLAVSIEAIPIGYLHTATMDWTDDLNTTSHGARQTWADKYITSPPITAAQMSVYLWTKDIRSRGWKYATVYDPQGITYGTTVEVLKKLRAPEPACTTSWKRKLKAGFTTISFVTQVLAPGSTVAWHEKGVIQSWDYMMNES
jgi:hypothetical protein